MKMINLTINGTTITAKEGQTILEVAAVNNVFIPTLCNDERVKPFGSCLLCRVEVDGARGNMLACATPVTEGMVVRTESEGINESRKMCLELLVSQHYGDCKAPCSIACPAQIDIQGYIAHIANGQYKEAVKLIKERNPLPLVCGRVCTRPCEDECRRNLVDERVGIDYLKRFVTDYDLNNGDPYKPEVMPQTGKKVAVIGAGPAGLSCSYYLAILGHDVTIFEKWPKGGGMLRYGIPEYRLPRGPLEREIELIKDLGVEIKYNTNFGKDITYQDLLTDGYGALFLAVGSQLGQPLGVTNDNLEGVMTGIDFLGKVNLNSKVDFSDKRVIVIGGGNTAVDAARTSLRLNATQVILAYRRTKTEMPAHEMEIEEAEYEGVKLELLVAPKSVVGNGKCVSGVEFIRMQLGSPDASGRRKPEEIPGSEFIIKADVVIAAIGQSQDLSFLNPEFSLNTNRSRVLAHPDVMTTNMDGVFAGGDVVTGPDSAISAIAAGRKAAYGINQYLKGETIEKLHELYNHVKGKLKDIDPLEYSEYEKLPREKMPMLTKEERHLSFDEVELGLSEESAKREAMRCLACGCKDVNECKLRDYTTKFEINQDRLMGELKLHKVDESHEFISHDSNKCIMCGLCVRICSEMVGAGVLGFNARGYSTIITPSFELPFGEDNRCENCGQCVSACPVGALTEKTNLRKPGPFVENKIESVCFGCGTGCSIVEHVSGNLLVRTTAKVGVGVNNGNLCEKGRFGSKDRNIENTLNFPYIRKNGVLEMVTWGEAFNYVGKKVKEIQVEHGNNSVGVFVNPDMTNEELLASKILAKNILKTEVFKSLKLSEGSLGLEKSIGVGYGTGVYEDIKNSDYIVCAGFDIKATNPVAALFVKQSVENGAKLTILSNTETKLARYASKNIFIKNEEIILLLNDKSGDIFNEYSNAKKPIFIIGDDSDEGISQAVGNFVKVTRNRNEGIILMHNNCNSRGLIEIGGNIKATSLKDIKCAFLFQDDLNKNFDDSQFKILFNANVDKTNIDADVIFPLAGLCQIDGTYTNSEGKCGVIKKSLSTSLALSNVEIIEKIINSIN